MDKTEIVTNLKEKYVYLEPPYGMRSYGRIFFASRSLSLEGDHLK